MVLFVGGESVAVRRAGRPEVLFDDLLAGQHLPLRVLADDVGGGECERTEQWRGVDARERPDDVRLRQPRWNAADLEVAGGHKIQWKGLGEVALDETVVVAEHAVPGHVQADRVEGPPGGVEETGDVGKAEARVVQVLLVGGTGLGVPVVRVVVLAVGDSLVLRQGPGVGRQGLAVEHVDVPAHLVQLAVVGVVAGLDGERQVASGDRTLADLVDRLHHRVGHLCGEDLLRPIARGQQADGRIAGAVLVLEPVDVLHSHRRLGVDDVDVGEVGEREHRGATACATGLGARAHVGAHDVRFRRPADDHAIAAGAGRTLQVRGRERGAFW